MIGLLRRVLAEVGGLFVSGWLETAVTLAIIAAGLVAVRQARGGVIGFVLAAALGLQLLAGSGRARRGRRTRRGAGG